MREIKLNDVCDVRDGTHDSPKYFTEGYPLVTSKNIVDGKIDISNVNYISSEDYEAINKRSKVDDGDILMPMIGTIGKPIIVEKEYDFAIKNVALIKFIKDSEVTSKFIRYVLDSNLFKRYVERENRGGTQKFLSLGNIRNFNFPLIPVVKQDEITNILDKTSSLIESRKDQLGLLDDLIKSRFVEMFGDSFENPKGYEMKRIDEVCEIIKGITYSPDQVADEGMIVLRSGNIQGSTFDLKGLKRITKSIKKEKWVKENDILMCNRNGSARLVGKVAKIPKITEEMTFGTFMTVVRSKYYEYLFAFFQTKSFREQIQFQTAVAINQISTPLLASVKLPMPSMDEQNQFATFVHQVDKLKLEVRKSLEETQVLFDSLMQEYFE